jgi:hypothetical protein
MGKVKGRTICWKKVRGVQPYTQHTLCKIVYIIKKPPQTACCWTDSTHEVLGLWKTAHTHGVLALLYKVYNVVCNQQASTYWTNIYGGHHKIQWNIKPFWSFRKQGMWIQHFSSTMVYAHTTTNVIFNILHDVLGSHVLPNQFPQHFRCGWLWPPWPLVMNSCKYFLHVYLKQCVSCTTFHTVLHVELEAVAETITGGIWDTQRW